MEKLFFQGKDGKKVDKTQDVYSLVKGDGPINFNRSDKTRAHIKNFIHSYKQMSKVWFTYSLFGRKHFKMSYDSVSKLNMRSVKSLRCSLGVLCNTNLEKILEEWKKKSKNNHPTITVDVYEEMEKQVHDLQAQKKVLNS
ncbi:hypothetical protein LIER_31099 [Lithospermum erythrorhizon]|uniref:Uncharacterized protein n=1 Tax=Lithospermum erythrorhizon TaxID=34254 RepID=A0AAV3RTG1_LITER